MTKVEAATMAADSGIPALVTSTANAAAALNGEDVGTWFSVNSGPQASPDSCGLPTWRTCRAG